MDLKSFKDAAEYLGSKGFIVSFETKKNCIEWQMAFDENGHFTEPDYDFPTYIYVNGKRYESDEITLSLARKAECIILAWDGGWTFYIGRTCKTATLQDAYENSLEWYVENEKDWEAQEATDEQAEQEAQEAQEAEQEAEQEAQEAEQADSDNSDSDNAPAAESVEDETWFCGTATPTDPDTAVQEADAASLTREAEDDLYQQRAAEQAAEKAKRRPITAFIITLIILIMCLTGAGTIASAFTKTADALNTPATATGAEIMATRIPAQKTSKPAATPAATTTPTPTTTPAATTTPATTPTLAQLLARALEAQKDAKTAPQTQEAPQTTKETLSLTTALKRALMAPKTGTTECVIYSTLYASVRIEEVTTPAPEQPTETPEEAQEESKSAWTIQADMRRIAFMRELRNVARGRSYNEQIVSLLKAIDASDDDFIWKTSAFTALPDDLKKAIKAQFEASECTDAEREECRTALDPHAERVMLHQSAIETAAEALARTAPEWAPLLYEEAPAPATLRQAILELQYCIFPIDSSPRARVFRGLEGIDFKTLSTPADYQAACKAASLRAGEPSTAIPPEARARIIQWRSGSVTTSATAVTSTAARLAAVWGMD